MDQHISARKLDHVFITYTEKRSHHIVNFSVLADDRIWERTENTVQYNGVGDTDCNSLTKKETERR